MEANNSLLPILPLIPIPTRVRKVASHLKRLPVELMEPVLSQVQTSRLLELALANYPGNAQLRSVILSSPAWRHLFRPNQMWATPEAVFSALVKLYASWVLLHHLSGGKYVRNFKDYRPSYYYYGSIFLSSTFLIFRNDSEKLCKEKNVFQVLHEELEALWLKVYGRYGSTVTTQRYRPADMAGLRISGREGPGGRQVDNFLLKVQALKQCQENFGKMKSKELVKLAELILRHPTRLKSLLDGREDVASTSRIAKHVSNGLRAAARKILRNHVFGARAAQAWFRSMRLPVVPRDACAHLFIRSLQTHPKYEYPENIQRDIETVKKGFVETVSENKYNRRQRVCLRAPTSTANGRTELEDHGVPRDMLSIEDPSLISFVIPDVWDFPCGEGILVEAHDEMEIVWLESFINCCEYFERTFPDIQEAVEEVIVPGKYSSLMRFGDPDTYMSRKERRAEAKEKGEKPLSRKAYRKLKLAEKRAK